MESVAHQQLVQHLLIWISSRNIGVNATVCSDVATDRGYEQPPSIMGFTPDVHSKVAGSNGVWIGEAKTAKDLETLHSKKQLETFLKYLHQSGPNSGLVVAVPWRVVRRAKSLITFIQRQCGAVEVEVVYLDQLPG
jgi:hypothetical protein